jgi:hypothetical protein
LTNTYYFSIICLVTDNVIINKCKRKAIKMEKTKSKWTNWEPLVGFNGQTDAFYRTNFKKVQVKFLIDKIRGECCCNAEDDFNLSFGVQLAYLRALNKARERQRAELEEAMKSIEHEIAENKTIIKKMVNSLK